MRIFPKFRTALYSIWRGCERLGILPPDVKHSWDANNVDMQALIVGYSAVRLHEDSGESQI